MGTVADISLVLAMLTTGLMSGVYLAFSISVLPGIARTDDSTFVAAMRGMNVAILNPVFAVVFGGPLVLDIVALATRLPDGSAVGGGIGWHVTALVLYVATLVITGVVNVPLNNRLDSTEPPEEARALFENRWVRWNVVRTVLCIASFVALSLALLS
jgi:uncharacterized membrane protein